MGTGHAWIIYVGQIEPIWQSAKWENVSNLVDLSNYCNTCWCELYITLHCLIFGLGMLLVLLEKMVFFCSAVE